MKKAVVAVAVLAMVVSATPAFAADATGTNVKNTSQQELAGRHSYSLDSRETWVSPTVSTPRGYSRINLDIDQYSKKFTDFYYRVYEVVDGKTTRLDDFHVTGDSGTSDYWKAKAGAEYYIKVTNYSRESFDESSPGISGTGSVNIYFTK
ncbi:hypothetical protein [Paenibacillus tyrfis]|uniref:Uncharacterized protein n=1 Tax=Paenibacillus tyrfis TaxID=1501230 RepID=A0A081P5H1_9BACL|nr:hypothetical protein [Paenibacillus tyrfis]KEQ25944.1 hypothetical protein ET33_35725 [Paenibacillus tyrfis]